jgi:hypothetical protein
MQKMPIATVFLCILQVITSGSTSPVPHDMYGMATEKHSDTSAEQHWREVPQLAVPVPGFV